MARSHVYAVLFVFVVGANLYGLAACGTSSTCLAAGTMVSTPSGAVPIERLRIGQQVLSVDPVRGTVHPARVVAIRSALRPCLTLRTASGRIVRATADHPFYVPARQTYEAVVAWYRGSRQSVSAWTEEGLTTEPVVACDGPTSPTWVYDITVASPFHNFLANGMLVHNKSEAAFPILGPIQDYVEIVDIATSTPAVPVGSGIYFDPYHGTGISVEADPAVVGSGNIRVTSLEPMDGLAFAAQTETHYLQGDMELTLPSPATIVDLHVTLKNGVERIILTIGPRTGTVVNEGEWLHFPP